jgi:signal transduction histidine kinase
MGARVGWSENEVAGPYGGAWDREDFLAHARLALALACTAIVYLNTAFLGKHVSSGRRLILIYLTYSLFNLAIIRIRRHYGLAWRLCLHAAEVIITSLITMFTGGAQSPFLGLYLFVLLVAAYRWGFNGALLTSCSCMVFLVTDLTVPSSWLGLAPHLLSGGSSVVAMMALSASLISAACLLGLLVEREKKQYGDAVVITRLVRSALPERSLRSTVGNTLESIREHFDADRVRLAIQEIGGEQAVGWEATRLKGKIGSGVQSWTLAESARGGGFAMPPEGVHRWLELHHAGTDGGLPVEAAWKHMGGIHRTLVSGHSKRSARTRYYDELYDLQIVSEQHSPLGSFWTLLATTFSFEGKWLGRLTVYNPRKGRDPGSNLRFLAALVREVGPAVYSKYQVARLRSRAQARERVRLVQELHDGVIQSLIGLEMQIDLLRRTQTTSGNSSSLLAELHRVQTLLHDEILNVREEMQRKKPLEVEPSRLLSIMADMVERFRRDLAISARFVADSQEVFLPPRVCREVVRILQEALANVRKHSGARTVGVYFGRDNEHWKLCITDDGRGFGFTGRLSPADIEASSVCPLMIKERVRSIGGELSIESVQGSGASMQILIPLRGYERVF